MAQLADQVEQAVRELVHRTRALTNEVSDPADAAQLVATLAAAVGMLPQLCDQLSGWLQAEQRCGRLRVDDLVPEQEPARAVHTATAGLANAGRCTRAASRALDEAHQQAAHLATN